MSMVAELREPIAAKSYDSTPAKQIANYTKLGDSLLEALDRVGYGGFVVNGHGDVSAINGTGRRLLADGSAAS